MVKNIQTFHVTDQYGRFIIILGRVETELLFLLILTERLSVLMTVVL